LSKTRTKRRSASAKYRWGTNPPLSGGARLEFVRQEKPDKPELARCWMQKEPARKLPNIAKVPTLIVIAEASYHSAYDHCTAAYLAQAGVKNTVMRLEESGIRGNGHMMMLEKNNTAIARAVADWIERQLESGRNIR
jgi:hypothetical protein